MKLYIHGAFIKVSLDPLPMNVQEGNFVVLLVSLYISPTEWHSSLIVLYNCGLQACRGRPRVTMEAMK